MAAVLLLLLPESSCPLHRSTRLQTMCRHALRIARMSSSNVRRTNTRRPRTCMNMCMKHHERQIQGRSSSTVCRGRTHRNNPFFQKPTICGIASPQPTTRLSCLFFPVAAASLISICLYYAHTHRLVVTAHRSFCTYIVHTYSDIGCVPHIHK